MEWLNTHIVYWHWMVLGMGLVASEIFVPRYIMLWFGASAVAVGLILVVVALSFPVQLLIWTLLSGVDLFIWFRFVQPRMRGKSTSAAVRRELLGQQGVVISKADKFGHGTLQFPQALMGRQEWPFICDDPIEIGDALRVEDVTGGKLIVTAA